MSEANLREELDACRIERREALDALGHVIDLYGELERQLATAHETIQKLLKERLD